MRRLAGDVRAERLRSAVAAATTPPTRLLVLVGLCAALWLLTGSGLWHGGAASQHLLWADAACQAAAEVDDGSPMLPSRSRPGQNTAALLRPWVQQAQDELSGLSEHVMQLRCGRLPANSQKLNRLASLPYSSCQALATQSHSFGTALCRINVEETRLTTTADELAKTQ